MSRVFLCGKKITKGIIVFLCALHSVFSYADLNHLSGIRQYSIADDIISLVYPKSKDEALIQLYFKEGYQPNEKQLSQVKKMLLAQKLFSDAARELQYKTDIEQASSPEQEAEVLSVMYLKYLKDKFQPSEAKIKEIYNEQIAPLNEGLGNVKVASFEDSRILLERNYLSNKIDDHYHTLLIGAKSMIDAVISNQSMMDPSMHAAHMASMRSMEGKSIAQRTAYMTSHFEAGAIIYTQGKIKEAMGHLSHPVSLMHKAEWEGLDKYGFKQAIFAHIQHMMMGNMGGFDEKKVLLMIDDARENLYTVAENADTDHVEITKFLLELAMQDYTASVVNAKVIDEKRYQDVAGYLTVVKYWNKNFWWFKGSNIKSKTKRLIELHTQK